MNDNGDGQVRCSWALTDSLMIAYHDDEWGIPCHDDTVLFERLVLGSFQAGLSWSIILRKREHFCSAFEGWDVRRIATYGPADVERLMGDAGIVRNRRKIDATVHNAGCFLEVQREFETFERYLWSFVGGEPLRRSAPLALADIPAQTTESQALSWDLRRHGFAFVGPTICYALMQSVGMVNDHVQGCFCATRI